MFVVVLSELLDARFELARAVEERKIEPGPKD